MLDETKLIAEIEAMMSENETVKVNAMKVVHASSDPSQARKMYNNARRENETLQSVLELINKLTN